MYESVIKSEEEQLEYEIAEIRKKQQEKIDKINALAKLKKNEYSENFDREFKKRIFKRDDYTCQYPLCGKKEDLTCHHIHYQKKFTVESEAICLCRGCNSRVNEKKKRKYWTDYFKNIIHYKLSRKEDG